MILAAGEAIVDFLPVAAADGRAAFVPVPGGAALNLARAVAAQGGRAALFCPLSSDPWGGMLREAARAGGVDAALCPATARPTTLAFVTVAGGQPAFAFHDAGSAMRGLTAADLPAPLPAGLRAVAIGGISLVPDPCGPAFAALARRAAGRAAVVLDANVRPAFVADPRSHRARLRALLPRADIVKLSDEDAVWLFGPGPPEGWAAAALAAGARVAVITRGAAGALAATAAGHRAALPAPPVAVADTVGAGDAFLAAFLLSLDRAGLLGPGLEPGPAALAAALAEGIAAGALACTVAGAGAPARAAVAALAARVAAGV